MKEMLLNIYGIKQQNVLKITNNPPDTIETDIALEEFSRFNYGVGYMLLLPTFIWNYLGTDYEMNLSKPSERVDDININPGNSIKKDVETGVQKFNKKLGIPKEPAKESQSISKLQKMYNIENSKYFTEEKIDVYLTDEKQVFKSLPDEYVKLLSDKLKAFEPIDFKEVIVNKTVAIDNLITKKADMSNEGDKIINWITKSLKDELFVDLVLTIYNGYIYLSRKGLYTGDVITRDLVPTLHYFTWQIGKPIDYQTLKYVVFQTEYQKELVVNQNQKYEAETILAQENIIVIQPKPEYQLWCLKRLLMIWYGDSEIEKDIRKIKILINQFRCNPEEKYNQENGILPSIVIYPKYGRKTLMKVLSKIRYYFTMYVDDDTATPVNIFWPNSQPTYFLRDNELIYHTNGSTDLKLYLEESALIGTDVKIDSFNQNMTKFTIEKSTY